MEDPATRNEFEALSRRMDALPTTSCTDDETSLTWTPFDTATADFLADLSVVERRLLPPLEAAMRNELNMHHVCHIEFLQALEVAFGRDGAYGASVLDVVKAVGKAAAQGKATPRAKEVVVKLMRLKHEIDNIVNPTAEVVAYIVDMGFGPGNAFDCYRYAAWHLRAQMEKVFNTYNRRLVELQVLREMIAAWAGASIPLASGVRPISSMDPRRNGFGHAMRCLCVGDPLPAYVVAQYQTYC